MTSEASELSPESESFLEEVIEPFQNSVSREMLHVLLTDHEAWERFVAQATLSKEETEALRERLNELQRTMNMEAEEHLARERFLNMFPELKLKLEERIRKLHELVDEVDRVHRGCTITDVVAGSTGAASGVLGILGLGLAPATSGASLSLLATGIGLGAASAATRLCSSIVEMSSKSSAIDKANRLILSDTGEDELFQKFLGRHRASTSSSRTDLHNELNDLADNVRAIRAARGSPQLAVQVRITSGVFSVLPLGSDVYNLMRHSRHLQKGAKAESAEDMRRQTRELESKLEKLTEFYERLKEDPTP